MARAVHRWIMAVIIHILGWGRRYLWLYRVRERENKGSRWNGSFLNSHEKYRQEKECLEENNPINGCME